MRSHSRLPSLRVRWVALTTLVVLAAAALDGPAWAGGLSLPGRGARPLGRAGSFVAGADDGGALYYNPAGLQGIEGWSLLVDAGLVLQRYHYERVDSGGNPQPAVDGSLDVAPLPTLVLTWKPKRTPYMTLAAGVWTPYVGQNSWPENGPQRYSLVSLRGTLILVAELAAAFRVHDKLWVGAGFQTMYLKFRSLNVLGTCTQVNCAPEDPHFDSLTQTNVTSGFTPSGVLGATLVLEKVRVGLALQLPFWIRADGSVRTRLPTDPMFANAMVVGDAASFAMDLPLNLRLGVEWRPLPRLRVELGIDYEDWAMQDKLVTTPHGVAIVGVPGVGTYTLSPVTLTRNLRDSVAVHIGAEGWVLPRRLVLRAGYLFESSATPDQTMSVLTGDGLKNMLTFGLGVQIGPVRLDLGYAHVFTLDRDVSGSRSYQLNPIAPATPVPVGDGKYAIDTDVLALGLDARF
jgi:long-chain fatty acid transport protein